MAALRIAQQALGAALAAPVEHRRGKTTFRKVARGFEIFLDAFVAARSTSTVPFSGARHRGETA